MSIIGGKYVLVLVVLVTVGTVGGGIVVGDSGPGVATVATDEVDPSLEPIHEITVNSTPEGAEVYVDDEYVGETRWEGEIEDEPVDVRVVHDEYGEEVFETVESGQAIHADFEDDRAELKVESDPDGATVYVDGAEVGSTPWVDTAPTGEEFEVAVEKDGYVSETKTGVTGGDELEFILEERKGEPTIEEFDGPSTVTEGERTLEVTTTFTGDDETGFDGSVTYLFDGTSVDGQDVSIQPGETKTITLTFDDLERVDPGSYEHSAEVGDAHQTEDVTVEAEDDDGDDGDSGDDEDEGDGRDGDDKTDEADDIDGDEGEGDGTDKDEEEPDETDGDNDIEDGGANGVEAHAGSDETVPIATEVTLDGGNSSPVDGLAFEWNQVGGEPVDLENDESSETSFETPLVDTEMDLVFELTVENADGERDLDTVTITVDPNVIPDHEEASESRELANSERLDNGVPFVTPRMIVLLSTVLILVGYRRFVSSESD